MHRSLAAAAAALALVVAAPAHAQNQWSDGYSADSSFAWKGSLAAGATLRVSDLNGGVDVVASDNGTTTVTAVKRWKRGDPSIVRILVEPSSSGATICALWTDATSCDGRVSEHHRSIENNDVAVHFTVHIARGVKVDLNTVNGSIDVRGTTAEVAVHTVNGHLEIGTVGGPVIAETVNGSVHASIDKLASNGAPLELSSVNGNVQLDAPAELDADLELETVTGGVRTDFPVAINGMHGRKMIRGTIGDGGRRVHLRTVNGSVAIRKLG
jgi:hypothetical protein